MHFIGYDYKLLYLARIFNILVSRTYCTTLSSMALLPAAETRESIASSEPGVKSDWLRWGLWASLQACVSTCVSISRFGIVTWGEE